MYNIIDVLCFFFDELSLFFKLIYLKVIDIFIFDIGVMKIVERSLNLEFFVVGEYCFNLYNLYGGFICMVVEMCKKLK